MTASANTHIIVECVYPMLNMTITLWDEIFPSLFFSTMYSATVSTFL